MAELVNMIYVDGNSLLTLCNIFMFVFVLEFFLCLVNILRGLTK